MFDQSDCLRPNGADAPRKCSTAKPITMNLTTGPYFSTDLKEIPPKVRNTREEVA